MSLPLKNVGLPVKNFVKIKASPQRIHIFYSTPKEILNFYILPMENSMVPQLGVQILNAIAPNPWTRPLKPIPIFRPGLSFLKVG